MLDEKEATATALLPEPRPAIHRPAPDEPATIRNAKRYDDETQARPLDDFLLATARQLEHPRMDVAYDSLPSLEVVAPFDAYEPSSGDQATSPRNPRNTPDERSSKNVVRESGKRLRDPHDEDDDSPPATQVYPNPNDDDSGPRVRKTVEFRPPEARSSEPHPVEAPNEVQTPRPQEPTGREADASAAQSPVAPREGSVPSGFVVGVQPIRLPMPPSGHHQPPLVGRTPFFGFAPQHPSLRALPGAHPMQMHAPPATGSAPGQMLNVEGDPQRAKTGRFVFFVFGAAIGILCAFFATGLAPYVGRNADAAAQKPAPAATTPPVAQQPAAQTAPLVAAPSTAAAPPAFAPAPPATVMFVAPPVAPAPVVVSPPARPAAAAPPPARAPRSSARRSSSSSSPAADEQPTPARAPAAKESKRDNGNVADLLSAGLGP